MAINFTLESNDRDCGDHYFHLQVAGEGNIEHYVDAFRSFLLAVGFHQDTIDDRVPIEPNQCPSCGWEW